MVAEVHFATDKVHDISPVRALADLKDLYCGGSKVGSGILSDLSPLTGLNLGGLFCGNNGELSDLLPLENCKSLTILDVRKTKVTPAQVAALQKVLPNCKIESDDPAERKTPEPVASDTK